MKDLITKRIIRNSALCLECNNEIISKFTHDFITCACGALSVNGGSSYLRRSYNNIDSYKDTSIYDYGDHIKRRENMRWGVNYDKDMNKLSETEWRHIKDLNTEHIEAIINNGYVRNNKFYEDVFKDELEYRNK